MIFLDPCFEVVHAESVRARQRQKQKGFPAVLGRRRLLQDGGEMRHSVSVTISIKDLYPEKSEEEQAEIEERFAAYIRVVIQIADRLEREALDKKEDLSTLKGSRPYQR